MVVGPAGENIGVIIAVDDLDKVVLIETPLAMHVVVSADVLQDQNGRVIAVMLTPARFAQMVESQGGRTAVYDGGQWTR
jgi:hypothetical protein